MRRERQGGLGGEAADDGAFGAETKYGTHGNAAPHKLNKGMQELRENRGINSLRRRIRASNQRVRSPAAAILAAAALRRPGLLFPPSEKPESKVCTEIVGSILISFAD
jgi:hypothetical protein